MPQKDYVDFGKMTEVREIGRIAIEDKSAMSFMTADKIEEILFNEKGYIENNTFVTIHQMANVYSRPASKYEVRIDENSVDIQIDE